MPHAEQFPYANKATADCGGSTGGQVGEPWPPDNQGRLQGVRFDQLRLSFGRIKDFTPVVDGQGASLFDLMSDCAPNAPVRFGMREMSHEPRHVGLYGPG